MRLFRELSLNGLSCNQELFRAGSEEGEEGMVNVDVTPGTHLHVFLPPFEGWAIPRDREVDHIMNRLFARIEQPGPFNWPRLQLG